jgi:Zn-finger nucleic acid-binding protein
MVNRLYSVPTDLAGAVELIPGNVMITEGGDEAAAVLDKDKYIAASGRDADKKKKKNPQKKKKKKKKKKNFFFEVIN